MQRLGYYDLATLIGHSTAGTNGKTNYIDLPGNCRSMWTGMKVLKHDDSRLHLIGYEPDFAAERSIDAARSSRDEFLEKALEVIMSEGNYQAFYATGICERQVGYDPYMCFKSLGTAFSGFYVPVDI